MKVDTIKNTSLIPSLEWICKLCKSQSQHVMEWQFQQIKDLFDTPGVKIGHLNVDGLTSKLVEVKIILQETNVDILAVIEAKIAPDITHQIEIEGYSVIRKD